MITQLVLRHVSDICAVQADAAAADIVKAQDQRGDGRFSAACSADDGRGLRALASEIQVRKRILFCIRKTESYMVKREHLTVLLIDLRVFVDIVNNDPGHSAHGCSIPAHVASS